MGASEFSCSASAKNATEAFSQLVEEARYKNGHGGYTGTIAEKRTFRVVTPEPGETPHACVRRCVDDDSHFSADKWGPAACVEIGPDPKKPGNKIFIFFGWASS